MAALEQSIEQIAQLRDVARTGRADMTVRHGDFGAVSIRIDAAADGDWRATLSSTDQGFVRAAKAAIGERGSISAGAALMAAAPTAPAMGDPARVQAMGAVDQPALQVLASSSSQPTNSQSGNSQTNNPHQGNSQGSAFGAGPGAGQGGSNGNAGSGGDPRYGISQGAPHSEQQPYPGEESEDRRAHAGSTHSGDEASALYA